jgi:hypothetical protein
MRNQVERLREATKSGELSMLEVAFPELFDVVTLASNFGLSEEEVEQRLLRLFQSYVNEFDTFMGKIDRFDWGRKASITQLMTGSVRAAAS